MRPFFNCQNSQPRTHENLFSLMAIMTLTHTTSLCQDHFNPKILENDLLRWNMQLLTKEKFFSFVENYERLTASSSRTAENIQSVCQRVEVFIPSDSPADAWDVQGIVDRYAETVSLSEDSKRSYSSRFNSAVSKFIAYEKGEDVKAKPKPKRQRSATTKPVEENSVKTFELPIPLRGDLIVNIGNLPRDLTREEAKRISNIIESFAMFDDLTKE